MSQPCAAWRDDIGAYILGALEPDESIQVSRHLEACAACRADFRYLLPVRGWLSSLAPAGEPAEGDSPGGPSRNTRNGLRQRHLPERQTRSTFKMAGVTAREEAPVYAAPAPQWAVATRKYVTEFIGTFFLTFAVGVAALSGSVFVPLAAGAILMAMIYAGGHISGGHYNPAVTLAALVRRRIGISDAAGYWIAQVLAGVVAAVIARAVVNPASVKTLALSGHGEMAAAVVELLITFALCYVVLNVATSKDQPGNGFFGLAIGFTVVAGAFAVGGISGGVFNPAVALGGATAGLFGWSTIWVYLLVQLAAGTAAGLAFRALNPGDK